MSGHPIGNTVLDASFRDPSGFLFRREGVLYRQVNQPYRKNYDALMSSGLFGQLVEEGRLIPHEEIQTQPDETSPAYKIIRPELVPFISYPYEWSFSQLKSAALSTLAIQKRALRNGLCLKDSSAYNIQFRNGRPVLIDTLSFEEYREGEPWVAYRQFCQHFLAPLALMAYRDVRLGQLARIYIDGIPLDLAGRLLPLRSRLNPGLFAHIHLHAMMQQKYAGQKTNSPRPAAGMNKAAQEALIDALRSVVRGLAWKPAGTVWGSYYEESAGHYSEESILRKKEIVERFLQRISPGSVWDLGANTGMFSRIASRRGIFTVAFDIDPAAVERNYLACKAEKETHLLPLVMDLTNPSPSIGWNNTERMALAERGPADALLALALIHHLAISNNVPFSRLAEFFRGIGRWLIIEFIPKSDSQAQILLSSREDIFSDYTVENFETVFQRLFFIRETVPIPGTQRVMYLMEGR